MYEIILSRANCVIEIDLIKNTFVLRLGYGLIWISLFVTKAEWLVYKELFAIQAYKNKTKFYFNRWLNNL